MVFLSVIQIAISLFVLIYARKILLSGIPSSLAIHTIIIIIFVSFGVALSPYLPIESLSYVNNPNTVSLIQEIKTDIYIRQCLSHWLFLLIAILGMRLESSWRKTRPNTIKRNPPLVTWGYLYITLGVLLSIKYYLLGPGWNILRETRLVFSSTTEAVAHRVMGYTEAGFGQGNYMASVAAYIFFPVAAALLGLKKNLRTWVLFSFSAAFSLAYAYQTRQKAPLLWSVLTYLFLIYFSKKENQKVTGHGRILILAGSVSLVGSVILYIINFGQTFYSAVERFLYRLFMVPAGSETNFFVVFPGTFPFRGIFRIFGIAWGRISMVDEVSIIDVARAATGDIYSANASFLAVAWSGGGYFGTLLVSLLLVAALVALDRAFNTIDRKYFWIMLALSPVYMVTLISDGVSTYIGRGGLIVPFMLFLITKAPVLSFKSKKR